MKIKRPNLFHVKSCCKKDQRVHNYHGCLIARHHLWTWPISCVTFYWIYIKHQKTCHLLQRSRCHVMLQITMICSSLRIKNMGNRLCISPMIIFRKCTLSHKYLSISHIYQWQQPIVNVVLIISPDVVPVLLSVYCYLKGVSEWLALCLMIT